MSKTIEQIVEGAARRLQLLGEGQTLRSDHSADLTTGYSELYAELEDIPTWSSTANIPDQYANAMSALLAKHRLSEYPQPPARMAEIRADAIEAKRKIWAIQDKPKMGYTKIENY